MLNHITIMGRITRDPELRRTGSGVAVTSFTVAVDRDYGEKGQKETDFIDCVAWRRCGEFVAKYFTRGRMIIVDGRLQIRNWTDKEGNKRRSAEVVADNCYFGDSKKEDAGRGVPQQAPNADFAGPQDGASFAGPAYGTPEGAYGGYPGSFEAGGQYPSYGGGNYGYPTY